jgi:uncharacterized paraquat-inducible protein A
MTSLRKFRDWYRLGRYPTLASFDPDAVLTRLRAREREERAAFQPWLTTVEVLLVTAVIAAWALVSFSLPWSALTLAVQIPALVLLYVIYRRIHRRVEAKVTAELGDGRLRKCVECDYDLRASEEKCPECGAPVRVAPPSSANS